MINIPARKIEKQRYRKLGNEIFVEKESHVKKSDADYFAKQLRAKGYKARVIPDAIRFGNYGTFRLFIRGKQKQRSYAEYIPSHNNPDPRKKKKKRRHK